MRFESEREDNLAGLGVEGGGYTIKVSVQGVSFRYPRNFGPEQNPPLYRALEGQ